MKNYFWYINKKDAQNGVVRVHAREDNPIQNYKDFFLIKHNLEVIEFYGNDIPYHITYDENSDTIRQATETERFAKGNYQLSEDEYVDLNGCVVKKPPVPKEIIKKVWDSSTFTWVEGATQEEIQSEYTYKKWNFYNSEIEIANKLLTEIELNVLPVELKQEIQEYLLSINPTTTVLKRNSIFRPDIFNRYNLG